MTTRGPIYRVVNFPKGLESFLPLRCRNPFSFMNSKMNRKMNPKLVREKEIVIAELPLYFLFLLGIGNNIIHSYLCSKFTVFFF